MTTKDKILEKHIGAPIPLIGEERCTKTIEEAMDEYAKQQAIEYNKWMEVNAVRNGEDVWLCRTSGFKTNLTSEQLYDQFIESQNK